MSGETILDNARLVLADEIVSGHLVLRGGLIAEVATGLAGRGEDMEGQTLVPGLIELHTDHIEGHYRPRPRVRWNKTAALQAHDAQVAGSGITTVFDALRVGMDDKADLGTDDMLEMGEAIVSAKAQGRLRADHFIHLRCEVSADNAASGFERFEVNPLVKLVSLMDHAPGQRQFTDISAYRAYHIAKFAFSEAEFDAFCALRIAESERYAPGNRAFIAERCRALGIALASHDDATPAHVEESLALGVALAEFPTTLEAARASHAAGLKVLMGGPNVVRGGSHSGNVSALDLQKAGLLDILSSDYVPFSLIQSVFLMAETGAASLPDAIRLVTKHPAEAVGLSDRGEIAPGLRADLALVRPMPGSPPVVAAVYREGRRVA
ncbi:MULTISPECIES: alpha-D-ribose 1-methylphosphonate 5-triphosphate diphosphatase [unclassified Aureimonas]|uniref:alpha-D-ribose 1-methylphosphonate 5-triphosphate diphosphatase n=1 Tax=unclassified Aureimonas TaxID=2615206 RepID=UPI0006F41823|nr:MULTISPECIES: alpha-D-ribose 1-methylphosphonate 5-triphosphate diphosphatase [unclassified Aureimonas]KQT52789.1 phosphonate metabolism protein PhnM [Aureimonas sp. Leaf427]KQT80248.1 phosphonate metabolism protein PhnM [Aureimonas sp. Leaf460]